MDSSDSPLVRHLLTSWKPVQPRLFKILSSNLMNCACAPECQLLFTISTAIEMNCTIEFLLFESFSEFSEKKIVNSYRSFTEEFNFFLLEKLLLSQHQIQANFLQHRKNSNEKHSAI